jgi:hypothetical protein
VLFAVDVPAGMVLVVVQEQLLVELLGLKELLDLVQHKFVLLLILIIFMLLVVIVEL